MKLEKIDVTKVSYDNYRVWLEQVAYKKQLMQNTDTERKVIANDIRKIREQLKGLYEKEADRVKKIEELKEELINALPNKF